jgi:MFS family permease
VAWPASWYVTEAAGGEAPARVTEFRDHVGGSVAAFAGVFANRNLRRVQLAFLGSEGGSWVGAIALSLLAFERGGTAGVGLALFLITVVPAVAAPFASVLADRLPRKRVMIGADLIRVVIVGAVAAAAFAEAPIGVFYALVPLASAVSTAFRPAQAAILPSLVRSPDELTAANVVSSTIESVTAFAGPAIGGVLVATSGAGIGFAVSAGAYAWSALILSGIHPLERSAEASKVDGETGGENDEREARSAAGGEGEPRGFLGEMLAGAAAIRRDRTLFLLVALMGAQVLVSGALFVLLVPVAFDLLGSGEEGYGALIAASGVGGLVGAAIAAGLVGRRLSAVFAIGVVLWGAPIALLALWQSQAGALVLVGIIGLANTLVDVPGMTLLQRAVPDEVLARVFGILEAVLYAASALGAIITPALIAGLGLEWTLVVVGVFLPALVALCFRSIARIDREAPIPERQLDLLRGVPFLAQLPTPTLEHLAKALIPVSVPAGQPVFEEGDPGDRFYLIAAGEVSVTRGGRLVRQLGPGKAFGEIALLRDIPRTATVTALTDLELYALEREEFLAAVTGHTQSREAADALVAARIGPPTAPRLNAI